MVVFYSNMKVILNFMSINNFLTTITTGNELIIQAGRYLVKDCIMYTAKQESDKKPSFIAYKARKTN